MLFSEELIRFLREGQLAVIPTDTLYGIVCAARSREAVERLYRVRGRDVAKPCILLIDDISALEEFGIALSEADTKALEKVWPGKVSVVFDCPEKRFEYLHRGTKTLAFRIPDGQELRALIRKTGPLLAPSANQEGQPPARTVVEARNYFGDQVATYVDGDYRESLPSTVARLRGGVWEVLRQGAVELAPHQFL
ncbi:MAG: L-threonylcarbamoyladenylate synthase [Patescibacteria group bacterium]